MRDAVLGHEMAGTVVEVGARARGGGGAALSAGDRVVSLHWDQTEAWPSPLTPKGPVSSFLGLTLHGGCVTQQTHTSPNANKLALRNKPTLKLRETSTLHCAA